MMQLIGNFTRKYCLANRLSIVALSAAMLTPASALAASVEIEWAEPDNYRDLHPGGNSREKFRETTFAELEQSFIEVATYLPEEQVLKIVVRDLDLAGYVNVESKTRRKRFISAKYYPRMKLSYKLFDATGKVVKAGGALLKQPEFMTKTTKANKAKSLGYEKQMIDEWFTDTFIPKEDKE